MPRISAPSLAEHQERQRARVIEVALELLAESGVEALTPARVAERAGLSRSSLYQYVSSSAELVALGATLAYDKRGATLGRATTLAEWRDRLLGFCRTPAGRAVLALERASVPDECRREVERWREEQRVLPVHHFTERGSSSPTGAARLFETLVEGAGYRFSADRARRLLEEMFSVE